MNPKKFKIILYLPLVLFFIANLFYFPLQAKAALNDSMPDWKMPDLQIDIGGLKDKFTKPTECDSDSSGNTIYCVKWIGEYIAGIYKYAIGIVGILAAVVLMIGGVMWIVAGGSATMIGEAKAWIGASLTGLVIALTSYLILYQINPALTVFQPLRIAQVKKTGTGEESLCVWKKIPLSQFCRNVLGEGWVNRDWSKCSQEQPNDTNACCCTDLGGTGQCNPTTDGPCAVSQMGCFRDKAQQASAICLAESGGVPNIESVTDKCQPNGETVSFGLFQINISAHGIGGYDCPTAFSSGPYTNSDKNCAVIDETLYENCKNSAFNVAQNIQVACNIYNDNGWSAWGANKKCGF